MPGLREYGFPHIVHIRVNPTFRNPFSKSGIKRLLSGMEIFSSKPLDYLGLVARMFDELGLGEMINAACPSDEQLTFDSSLDAVAWLCSF